MRLNGNDYYSDNDYNVHNNDNNNYYYNNDNNQDKSIQNKGNVYYVKYSEERSNRQPSLFSLIMVFLICAFFVLYFIYARINSVDSGFLNKYSNYDNSRYNGSDNSVVYEDDGVDYIKSKDEIEDKLREKVLHGDENFVLYISTDISEEDIKNEAQKLEPEYDYTDSTYVIETQRFGNGQTVSKKYATVTFNIEIPIESIVYESIINGKEIPDDNEKALKLKEACERFLESNISDEMTDYKKELSVHDYIIYNCEYHLSTKYKEDEHNAYGALVDRKAVCDGYARAADLLLKICGIETKIVYGMCSEDLAVFGSEDYEENHAWNLVKIDGKWYHIDITWDDGDHTMTMDEFMKHQYFNVTDEFIGKSHEWERTKFEKCFSDDANYTIMRGLLFTDNESFENYVREELANGNRDTIECVISNVYIGEDTLCFIFEYDGVERLSYGTGDYGGNTLITIFINY